MAVDKQPQSRHVPVGLAGPGGFPWSRLVVGLLAVLVSMTTDWRAEVRNAVEEPISSEAPPPPTRQTVVAPLALQPQPAAPPLAALPADAPLAAPVHAGHVRQRNHASASAKLHLQRTSSPAKLQRRVARRPNTGAISTRIASNRVERAQLARSRAELRREYIGSRAEVAALTGEDSGSAWLSRQGARHGSAAQAAPGQGRRPGRLPALQRS